MHQDDDDTTLKVRIPFTPVGRFVHYSRSAVRPPDPPWEAFMYGLAQPVLGARTVVRHRSLLFASLFPALLVLIACALLSLGEAGDGAWPFIKRFYLLFVAMAPLPSLLFGRHYARMAVDAWARLGFGPRRPRILPLRQVAQQWLMETALIWVAAAPGLFLLNRMPILGSPAAFALSLCWALHWVVVNALESARTLPMEDVDAEDSNEATARLHRPAWFSQPWHLMSQRAPPPFNRFAAKFARVVDRLSAHSDDELEVVEAHPFVAAGFAVTTAALLGIPGLNLLFRPFTLVGAAHILAQLEPEQGPGLEETTVPLPLA